MSEKVTVSVLVEGGAAKPSGSLAPQLGPTGVNLGQVIMEINKQTESYKGMKVPVDVIVDKKTRTFELVIGIPPASALVMKEAKIAKGSGTPQDLNGGDITYKQVLDITKAKRPDLLGASMKTASLEILGTMKSMGVKCNGDDPMVVQQKVQSGEFDAEIADWEANN
jgi:large subunit ribosomal protein L11